MTARSLLSTCAVAVSGYILKPPELREGATRDGGTRAAEGVGSVAGGGTASDDGNLCSQSVFGGGGGHLWPPARESVTCVTLSILSLHHLPTRREARPRLHRGKRAACHQLCSTLSGRPAPPDPTATPSSPQIKVELFSIGGYHQVSRSMPPSPPPARGTPAPTSAMTAASMGNGLHAILEDVVHLLAAEPLHTVLRVSVLDREVGELAFETVVLGVLRQGYRCLELRSLDGSRIELCTLLVHVEVGSYTPTVPSIRSGSSREAPRPSQLEQAVALSSMTSEAAVEFELDDAPRTSQVAFDLEGALNSIRPSAPAEPFVPEDEEIEEEEVAIEGMPVEEVAPSSPPCPPTLPPPPLPSTSAPCSESVPARVPPSGAVLPPFVSPPKKWEVHTNNVRLTRR